MSIFPSVVPIRILGRGFILLQYSFHTPLAVSALKFVGVDDVY